MVKEITKDLKLPDLSSLLEDFWPSELVMIHSPSDKKHICYFTNNIHGVAVFSSEIYAQKFLNGVTYSVPLEFIKVSFDEAREIAKAKKYPIVAIHLLDDMTKPLTHYIA